MRRLQFNRRWIAAFAGLGVGVILAVYIAVSWQIGSDVNAAAQDAMTQHAGDRVMALVAYIDDPAHSLRNRNRAVWALGQLGDDRALAPLERHDTGGDCDHARLLCQHELDKAIRLLKGRPNLSAFVWR